MSKTYRRHSLINAPVEDVWAVVSDPQTHPDWWPEVRDVQVPEELAQDGEYVQTSRRLGFLDVVDSVWTTEKVEHLKQVHFRCTLTGTYTRFSLTPAQDETFVEIEAGVDPVGLQGRAVQVTGRLWLQNWLRDLLDALPSVVTKPPPRDDSY